MRSVKGKLVLVIGAETELGGNVAAALAEGGATLALVSSRPDAEAAFAVQRRARKVGAATSQAIDGSNETATKVMARQVAKALGGLDVVIVASTDAAVRDIAIRIGEREVGRSGGVCLAVEPGDDVLAKLAALPTSA